jgi:hypothetical protein
MTEPIFREPDFGNVMDEGDDLSDQGSRLVNIAANEMASAAYWKGVHDGQGCLIAFLKDRLDRFERGGRIDGEA